MTLENLMNEHMENMEERVLSEVIPLDILRIITITPQVLIGIYFDFK